MGKVVITFNGRTFEDRTGKKHIRISIESYDLSGVYGKPSTTKKEIWEDWLKWATEVEKVSARVEYVSLWINSHNCNMFTIGGKIVYNSGDIAHIYITPTKQEYWED